MTESSRALEESLSCRGYNLVTIIKSVGADSLAESLGLRIALMVMFLVVTSLLPSHSPLLHFSFAQNVLSG